MKAMWLSPPSSGRTRWARYTPDTDPSGTVHRADSAQFPQSTSPVDGTVRQGGWDWGNGADGAIVPTMRAPWPWYHPSR